jgi:hypothetical protein
MFTKVCAMGKAVITFKTFAATMPGKCPQDAHKNALKMPTKNVLKMPTKMPIA